MMLSKLGALESAQATEYLTSIMNGFKIETEDASRVVDKLISVDNIAATSAGELSTALSYTSAVANQSKVSFDQMVAMIGVVSSVTRVSAETIGQAFKTILTRMQAVAANKSVDEFGDDINNVEKTLRGAGIEIRATATTLRPLGEVLDEVASKWETFGTTQQNQIAGAMAGVRQANTLLTLFQNYGDVQKYMTAETESAGLAMRNYKIYLEGVEAAQNRVTASWEKLVQTTVSSGAIAGFYNTVAVILELIDALGGLVPILVVAGLAYATFALEVKLSSFVAFDAVGMLITSVKSLYTTMTGLLATNPAGWAILVVGALLLIANAIPTVQERIDKLNKSINTSEDTIKSLRDQAKEISSLASQYSKLNKGSQEYIDVQNRLKDLIPELNGYYDEHGNFIIAETENIDALTQAIYDKIEAEKKSMQLDIDKSAKLRANELKASFKKVTLAEKGYETLPTGQTVKIKEDRADEIALDYRSAIEENKAAFKLMSADARLAFIKELGDSSLAEGFWRTLLGPVKETQYANLLREYGVVEGAKEAATLAFESFASELEKLVKNDDTINKLFEKSITEGLDFSDIKEIPEAYAGALVVEGDKLKLNLDLVRQLQLVEAERSLAAIRQAYDRQEATAQEVAVIQLYYDKLQEATYVTVNGIKTTAGAFSELAWNIANDAAISGNSFVDLQNRALTSTEAIYKFLTSGDIAFNSFVQQAAIATGHSVEEVANAINSMIYQVIDNTTKAMQYAHLLREYGMSATPAPIPYIPLFTPALSGYQYPGGLAEMKKGGGGGESKADKRAREEAEREREEAERLRKIEQDIADARKDSIDDLKHQLSIFKDITDERKKQLDLAGDEREYNQDVEEKNKEILNIQTELNALQFDDSEEADARRLALQDELANLSQELGNIQYDQSLEQQKNAIDAEYDAFRTSIDNAIREIEHISAGSVGAFANQLAAILSQMAIPTFHEGGIVGSSGTSVKGNEVLAKLLSGEVVSTQEQGEKFIRNTLPQLIQGASTINGANIDVSIPIQVMGNLDRAALPGLEKMIEAAVKRLNDNLLSRGYTRRAEAFGN